MTTGVVWWTHLSTLAEALAAATPIGALVVALLYARRANASVTATAHRLPGGELVLDVRPSVTALGPLTLRFSKKEPPQVEVTEVLGTASGTTDGVPFSPRQAFPDDERGKAQFVSPGETLTSMVLFRGESQHSALLGWCVCLSVRSRGIVRHGLSWGDRVFVPLPKYAVDGAVREGEDGQDEQAEAPDNRTHTSALGEGSGQEPLADDAARPRPGWLRRRLRVWSGEPGTIPGPNPERR